MTKSQSTKWMQSDGISTTVIPNTTKNFNHFEVVKFSLLHFWTFCQKNLATQKNPQ